MQLGPSLTWRRTQPTAEYRVAPIGHDSLMVLEVDPHLADRLSFLQDAIGGRLTMVDPAMDDLPARLAAPAGRALAEAGYARLEQLTHVTEAELGQLYGIGPKALGLLREVLAPTGPGIKASAPVS